jgi:hypothetical protein
MNYKIRKNISRKINTGSYENIVISVDIEKDIECGEEDVKAYLDDLTKQLINDFKITQEEVFSELELGEKKAWGESAPSKMEKPSDDDMKNIFGE